MKTKITFKVNFPKSNEVKPAMKKALEAGALAFERKAKLITTEERHVVTGRYRASINLNSKDGIPRDTVKETKSGDGVHEFVEELTLRVGSNVEYAGDLEKKYGIMGRALDSSQKEMFDLFFRSLKETLKWIQ